MPPNSWICNVRWLWCCTWNSPTLLPIHLCMHIKCNLLQNLQTHNFSNQARSVSTTKVLWTRWLLPSVNQTRSAWFGVNITTSLVLSKKSKMVSVSEIRQAQRAEGPATILAIGTATPQNCVDQSTYPDYYFRITNSEHMTELKEKFQRMCKFSHLLKTVLLNEAN